MTLLPNRRRCLLAAGALATLPQTARSQNNPMRIVVPFSAGGGLDACARMVADALNLQGERGGPPTMVENKTGAGGNIGVEYVVRARPDGLTVLMASFNNVVINRRLYKNLSFDPVQQLAPVCCVWSSEALALVNPNNVPVHSLSELVQYAKSADRSLNMGSSGNGSGNHIIGELFQRAAGVRFNHIPYKGAAPAMTDLIGGHLDLVFDSLPSGLGPARKGLVRAIGITGATRHPALPDVASYVESGYEAASVTAWGGLLVPVGTPQDAIDRLAQAVARAGPTDMVKQRIAALGLRWHHLDPTAFSTHIAKEALRWEQLLGEMNIALS